MGSLHTVIVNLKNYKESTGRNLETFLRYLNNVDIQNKVRIIIAVNPLDIVNAKKYSRHEIFSQTVDPAAKGAFTGKIPMESLLEIDVKGSLVNHSENRIESGRIESIAEMAGQFHFETVLCVESLEEAKKYAPLHPSFIAYEPPMLIGGDVSVTSAEPSIISNVVKSCIPENVRVLVGAGVKNPEDARMSIKLGADGVLIASGIVKAKEPAEALNGIIKGITDSP